MFIRPSPEDFDNDAAIEAFAHRVWHAFTTQEKRVESRLTERHPLALTYATMTHSRQTRKGDAGTPYISHLLAVSSLVLEAGGDEDEAIAALLHDAAEDQGGEWRLTDIGKLFGSRVSGIVRECSDSLTENPEEKADWGIRKTRYIDHLKTATPSALLVSAADKTHNARSLVSDIRLFGVDYLQPFTASAEQTIWYYEEVLKALSDREVSPRLLQSLAESVGQLRALIEAG